MGLTSWWSFIVVLSLASLEVHGQNNASLPRWGQASAIIYDILYVHGGKTDPSHQFTYTSAPNSNDLLMLDLSTRFPLSAPPWMYIAGSQIQSSSQGPAVAFHTLTPYTTSRLLLFGGDAGFAAIGTNADSAWLLDVTNRQAPMWQAEPLGWASEPPRRVYHAAPSASGAVYIVGGQRGDNSQLGFSESYIFNAVANDGSPNFIPLSDPTTDPARLFGHAAHMLSNGILIVFGGYFAPSNSPCPFTTIYMLNTTSSSLSWFTQNTSGTAPSSRRGFASVLLDNGKILIHGGADAALQTVYSDGALLDTTQSPMQWSPVNGLASVLGARVGHFAVPIGSRVLFGFGWAGNAPASAELAMYDPKSNTFVSSYTPETSTPAPVATLPSSPLPPGATFPSSGAGNPFTPVPGSTPSGTHPNHEGGAGGGGDGSDGGIDSKSHVIGIVLGSVFGIVSFVALVGAGAYYTLRKRERHPWTSVDGAEGRWRLTAGEWDPDDSPQPEQLQMAGTGWQVQSRGNWDFLGLGALVGGVIGKRDIRTRQRLDMLADEDARQFELDDDFDGDDEDWHVRNVSRGRRREGTGGSSLSFGAGKYTWSEMFNASVTSLRAALGFGVAGTAKAGAGQGRDVDHLSGWEKEDLPLDPFSDAAAIGKKGEDTDADIDERPHAREYSSTSKVSTTNVDPFSDTVEDHLRIDDYLDYTRDKQFNAAHDEGMGDDVTQRSSQTLLASSSAGTTGKPRSAAAVYPGPSTSVESHQALSLRTTVSNSNSNTGTNVASSSSHSSSKEWSSGTSIPNPPRSTSIIGTSASVEPMRRSDSWWSRFSRTSFRERHSQHELSPTGEGLLDFRDPNPAPRLNTIREASQSTASHPETAQEAIPDSSHGAKRRRKGGSGYAASTRSSVKTDHTADSEAIERMGGRMEVVQRAISLHSRRASSLSNMTDSYVLSDDAPRSGHPTAEASGFHASHGRSWTGTSELSNVGPLPDPEHDPPETPSSRAAAADDEGPTPQSDALHKNPLLARARPLRRSLSGTVAARVSMYEQRISLDNPLPPSPSSRTEGEAARKRHTNVAYGLVPKAPLYVANPDR